uniref:Uncharacterized protein n=2 Tax=Ciona intestinalis TaxID=7719 RepID=H2Y3E2_CIOIN
MYSFVFKLICVSVICFNSVQGCHYGEYKTPGRKKRSTDVALYDSTSLIIWFTNCMKRTSAASTNDWYSATAWTIADSNWFFYTENKHCKDSSTNTQETECWISKVNSFFHDPVATTVKTCIYEYQRETAKSGVAPATLVLKSGGRKRRQSGVTPTFLPTSPPVCPVVNSTNYENGLALQVPPDSRTDLPPNENFDLYSVSQFLRNNTSCSECETYRPRNVPASECWAQHFSQQTRDLSTVKFPVQRVNARYAD